jgi:hypothetical protein
MRLPAMADAKHGTSGAVGLAVMSLSAMATPWCCATCRSPSDAARFWIAERWAVLKRREIDDQGAVAPGGSPITWRFKKLNPARAAD